MSLLALGLWSMPVLLGLIFLRAPVGLAMLVTGAVGLVLATGNPNMILAKLKTDVFSTYANYNLAVVPMFLLMGHFATMGGMSAALFRAAEGLLGHRRGGVGMATIGACAGFGAICGSSMATAATMGQVALPELRRAGYAPGLAGAVVAAGGTLGILIPPSVVLVIYAILTEQNIARLFLAAFVPGLLAAGFYIGVIALYVRVHPQAAGVMPCLPMRERLHRLVAVWPVLAVFGAVVGGIYGGLFTPAEGASIGAAGTFLIALATGGITRRGLGQAILSTAQATGMVFFIVLGAGLYNSFLALTQVPQALTGWAVGLGLGPIAVLALILLIYLALGCVMDSLSMILLTVPIFWPVMLGLDFGMTPDQLGIWFGILVLIAVEVGLITPPVGMNLFVIQAMDRSLPAGAVMRAVGWFVAADIARVALLVAFPAITLFLI